MRPISSITAWLDSFLPLEVRRSTDLALFRGRCLILVTGLVAFIFSLASLVYLVDQNFTRFTFIFTILAMSVASLIATMRSPRHDWIGALYLGLLSLFISRQLLDFHTLFLPAIYAYPLVILAGFLVCGQRIGLILTCWTLLHSLLTMTTLQYQGWNPPIRLSWIQITQNYIGFCFLALTVSASIISFFLGLIENTRRTYNQERAWLETAESMQDVLAITARIAKAFEAPVHAMQSTSQELSRSRDNPQQSALWTRGIGELHQNAGHLHSFHRSFQLITESLYKDHAEVIDPRLIAQHILALTWARPADFQIQAETAPTLLRGRQSTILLLLLVLWHEAIDRAAVSKLRRLRLSCQNQRLVADFDGGFPKLPRLAQQLSRALHATYDEPEDQASWRLTIPLEQAG